MYVCIQFLAANTVIVTVNNVLPFLDLGGDIDVAAITNFIDGGGNVIVAANSDVGMNIEN